MRHNPELEKQVEEQPYYHPELHSPYKENILYELAVLEEQKNRLGQAPSDEIQALADELRQVEAEQVADEKVKLDDLRALPEVVVEISDEVPKARELRERMTRLLGRIEEAINAYGLAVQQHRFISLRKDRLDNGTDRLDQVNRSRKAAHNHLLDGLRTFDTLGQTIIPTELHLSGQKREQWKQIFANHMLPRNYLQPANNPGRERVGEWALKMSIFEKARSLETTIRTQTP